MTQKTKELAGYGVASMNHSIVAPLNAKRSQHRQAKRQRRGEDIRHNQKGHRVAVATFTSAKQRHKLSAQRKPEVIYGGLSCVAALHTTSIYSSEYTIEKPALLC